jgi:hypothetical protein
MKINKYALAAALGLVALAAQPAHADNITTYTINFTTTSTLGSPLPVAGGFFTYDSSNPKFSNFLVNWNGEVYDLTAAANAPAIGGSGCTGEAATPAFGFMIMSQTLTGCAQTQTANYLWVGILSAGPSPPDSFTFVVAPLPSGGGDTIWGAGTRAGTSTFVEALGTLSIAPVTTPEPSTIIMLGTGLLGLLRMNLRRKRPA